MEDFKRKYLILAIVLLGLFIKGHGQTSEYRASVSVEKQLFKSLKIVVSPSFRTLKNFSTKEYLIDGGISFKPIKYIDFGALYRFDMVSADGKDATYKHRYFFSTQLRYSLFRLDAMARAMFTNDGDAGIFSEDRNNYMRYRLKLKYNIKSFKLTPFISAEYFYQLNDREFNKSRYTIGGEYKISKSHSVVFEYSWQDYLKKDKTLNIFSLGYNFNF